MPFPDIAESTSQHQSWQGVRTPLRQFASCVLVDIDDTLDSIFSSDMAIGKLCRTEGWELVSTQVESVASTLKSGVAKFNTRVSSRFSKNLRATVRCCTQNGIRGGSATVHFPIWHQEIEDILVLKNNKGTEDNRVRKLDYSIQVK